MGFFFLLAGYYTPRALERKGGRKFLIDRLIRLGIPLTIYFFVLSPFTIALAQVDSPTPFWERWRERILVGDFEPGPLWFVEALLLFSVAYQLINRTCNRVSTTLPALPRFFILFPAVVLLGLISFAVRLVMPAGQTALWLQLGYFPCYIFLFAGGCLAAQSRILEGIRRRHAMPWMVISALGLIALPIVMTNPIGQGPFEGGWNLNALFYAIWDPFMGFGIILGMLWWFGSSWLKSNRFTEWLARRVYGAYIVHPPVLVAVSVFFAGGELPAMLKFAAVSSLASAGSFLGASALLAIPGAKRVL